MLYYPNIPFAIFQIIKAKNWVFYTAANPSIENAGIGTESKYYTQQLLPSEYLPKTIFHLGNSDIYKTIQDVKKNQIKFPLIAKPDVGFRGLLVKKIETEDQLISYLEKYPIDILVQEFLTEENECGIFYHRFPNNKKGKISSITLKKFLHVVGNGESTLDQLIKNDARAKLYIKHIKQNTSFCLDVIIDKGEEVKLSLIGNHSKGTQFINGNHLISKELEKTINQLNQKINGWYYGRLDIKYNSLEDLEKGDFKILELNGILAEPTHIYDTHKTTYWQALKAMRTHWKLLAKISRMNHDHKSIPYQSTKKLIYDLIQLKKYTNRIAQLSNDH
jgi:hypothetical protein